MTNSPKIAECLHVSCDRSHEHITLIGNLANRCNRYPPLLVDRVLRALRRELISRGTLSEFEAGGSTVEERDPWEEYIEAYWDEVTGEEFDTNLVEKARAEEVEYMHKLKVYEGCPLEEATAAGCVPIPVRWVDMNKGDRDTMKIRSRAVTQETKWRTTLHEGGDQWAYHTVDAPADDSRALAHPDNTWLEGDWRRTVTLAAVFPTHTMQIQPDMLWYLSIQPHGTDQVAVRWAVSIPREILADGDREALVKQWDELLRAVNEEDKVIIRRVREGVNFGSATQGRLAHLERNLWEFGQYYSRLMTA